jgi:small-conductance mechanosensitive channel
MEKFEFRKRSFFLVVSIGVIAILLLVIPADTTIREFLTPLLEDRPVGASLINLATHISHIVKILLWMAVVIIVIRYVNFLAFNTIIRSAGQNEISSLLRTVLSIIVSIVAFFIIFQSQYPNVELAPIFTGSTILGIVVGLALQDTLGNLFSGIALQADHPFQVGDVVNIQNGRWIGVVEGVSWRGVKIRTFQNKVLLISNAVLGREFIEIAVKGNTNAHLVFFNTVYSASPARTIKVIREVLQRVDNVRTEPKPIVRIRNLAESGIDYEIKYWPEDYARVNETDAQIRQRVWYAFRREDIHFAFPTRTVYIEEKSSEQNMSDTVSEIFDRLNEIPVFAPLSDEETQQLAESVESKVFSPDEAIVRRGQEGSSMFVIRHGSVKVQVRQRGKAKVLLTLGEGEFFGEMALFTGEPRSATVIALEETEVFEIRHEALKPLLENNPDLAERFGELIAARRARLSEATAESQPAANADKSSAFLSIRKFFGLK